MKKFKALLAAVMAAAMAITMTGCDEESEPADVSTPNAATNNSGETSQTVADRKDMDDEAVNEAAKALKDQVSYPDLKITKRIKWLAWWSMDETSGESVLFKEVYGIPETGMNEEDEGHIFDNIYVDYGARTDRLATMVASDESPDIFPFEVLDFPYGVLMNRYDSIDDIVDFNSEKWAGVKDLNEQFVLNGKHYTSFYGITLADLMWYKKSNIESIGAEDPQELFNQGKWNWDTMLEIGRKWKQSGTDDDPKFLLDGYNFEDSFVTSTGVPMVGNDGKKIVSNLRTSEVERAITGLVSTLQKESLIYPRHELNSWNQNPSAWANDTNLFLCEGTWRYEEDLQVFKRKFKWPDDEIKVVPFPKDPQADKYYIQIKCDCNMLVKGSKNKEGVQAWLDCCITTSGDKTLAEASKQKAIKNPKTGWTEELLDFLNPLYAIDGSSNLVPIIDFKKGLGPNVFNGNADGPITALTALVSLQGDSFVTLRDENESAILKAIDDVNAKIAG